MERGEPSLVPEWLRSTTPGSGTGAGSSSHHFSASQTDRTSSSNSRRTSTSNGSPKHDSNSYSRSYTSFNRNRREKVNRERLTITDNWDLEYSDPLRSMISGKKEGLLRRSQSMISKRQGNGIHNIGTGVSFEREFPQLGTDERPKTPDIVRVSSPGLSRSVNIISIGNSPLIGNEGWTSALAEVPNSTPQPSPGVSGGGCNATSGGGTMLSGLNMAKALVQTPARSQNTPQSSSVQSQRDELAIAQSKKLIPMTPSLPKILVNQSDKLKPKTPLRSNEVTVIPKNGVHHLSPLHLGGQSTRAARGEGGPKSPSSKLLVLKPVRENGTVIMDPHNQTTTTTTTNNRAPNNNHTTTTTTTSVGTVPLKSPSNFQSRSDFFKMMRRKSMNTTSSVPSNCGNDGEMGDGRGKIEGTRGENGGICSQVDDENAGIYPNEEEKAFLRSLGWEESGGDDEALTEEEINAFYQEVWRLRGTSKLCRDRLPKILSHFELGPTYPAPTSTEPNSSTSGN